LSVTASANFPIVFVSGIIAVEHIFRVSRRHHFQSMNILMGCFAGKAERNAIHVYRYKRRLNCHQLLHAPFAWNTSEVDRRAKVDQSGPNHHVRDGPEFTMGVKISNSLSFWLR